MTDGGYTREEVARMHGYDRMPDSYFFWLGADWARLLEAKCDELEEFIEVQDLRP